MSGTSDKPDKPDPYALPDYMVDAGSVVNAPHLGILGGEQWAGKKAGRVSVFVLDSTPIIQMREGKARQIEAAQQQQSVPASQFDPFSILNYLSKSGQNTLILTHTVLRELMRNGAQSYGIGQTPDGTLALNTDSGRFDPKFKAARLFVDWLDAHKDQIRLYPSTQAMLDAGEFDQAKGGIVIVDDPQFRSKRARSEYPRNGTYSTTPPNAGEASIITLCDQIERHYDAQMGKGFAVIGMDKDLRAPINNLGLEHPGARTPKVFNLKITMSALCRANIVNPDLEAEMYELLCRKNDPKRSPDMLDGNDRSRITTLIKHFTRSGHGQELER